MTITVILALSVQSNDCAQAQTTNLYRTNRVFSPIAINASPTKYSVSTMAGKLTEVIKGEDVRPISNQTYATEYDSMAWGYGSAAEAWGAVVSNFPACSIQTNTGVYYDNAGWVKGTHEVAGPTGTTGSTWGAYLWLLQNRIEFMSSTSTLWVTTNGGMSVITQVFVRSLGDYQPKQSVVDVGPTNDSQGVPLTDYLGAGQSADVRMKPDLTTYYQVGVLSVEFVKLSETANPANYIFNPTPKDDPPPILSNRLYEVESTADNQYHVTLEVNDQPSSMRSKLMHAVYDDGGTKLSTGEDFFPASGPADIVFDHPGIFNFVADFEIRVGYDLNGNSSLDANEILCPLEVKDTSGRVIGPPMVRGASAGRYQAARTAIFVGTYATFLPHTAYLLDVFRDPAVATVASPYKPTLANTVGLNCFSGAYSEWLTHNSGATFPASGGTTILEYEWDFSTTFATNLVGNSFEVTNALITYYSTVVLPAATAYFTTSTASTATFPLSASFYDIPHFDHSPAWPHVTVLFDDPALSNAYEDDPYTAIARARLTEHKASYSLERVPLPGGGFTVQIVEIYHFGEITDLYDFNQEAAFPAPEAAIVQIGFGNGAYGRTEGQIYRTKVTWDLVIP